MNMAAIGNRLRLARKSKGLTICEVQEKTGIDRGSISKFENGKMPDMCLVRHLDAFCKLYNLKATTIVRVGQNG
jgi:transcriptional regulator with XRE-family HTH domain